MFVTILLVAGCGTTPLPSRATTVAPASPATSADPTTTSSSEASVSPTIPAAEPSDGGTWSTAPPMLHARGAHAVVATDEAIYVLAGTNTEGPVLEVERFDGEAWSVVARLPVEGLNAPAAVALAGRIYLIGGFGTTTNVPVGDVLVFDPGTGEWLNAAPLPTPRGGHAAIVIDGRIHVIGGGNASRTLDHHDVYDPETNSWSSAALLPRSEGSPAAAVLADRLYAIGGRSGSQDFGEVDVWDPATGAWTARPPIPPRGTAGAAVMCEAVYLFGGESQSEGRMLDEVLRLDPVTGWQRAAPMPTARNYARAVVFDDAVFVVGGSPTSDASHASPGSTIVERFDVAC